MTKTELRFGKDTINIPIKPVARLGVNYQVAEATFLRASFGQGYRFPAVSEKFISMSLGAVKVFPNLKLTPETSWSVEVGAKQGYKFGKWKGFADAAVYFQRMYDMMEFGFVIINTLTGEPWEPMEENTLADSISVGVPRNADKAIAAIIESGGIPVEVTDDEILEAMRVTGRECGVFGEPAGVTGMAGLSKLCREGKIPADATVVAIVTGNGLKDTANGIKAAGEPIKLEPDIDKFRKVYEELNK